MPLQPSATQLLDALEGVAYLTDPAGTIVAIGRPGWELFAADNAAPGLTVEAALGTSVFDAIHGDAVRQAYRRLHDAVASGRRTQTVFDYRCDSPIAERHMRMAISPVLDADGVIGVLYQSQILTAVPRLPVPLFSPDARAIREGHPPPTPDRMVMLCSFCQRVAWPQTGSVRALRWTSVAEYYRRGGPDDAVISDGICPACSRRVIDPNL